MAYVDDAGCYLTLTVDGTAKISERGPKDQHGHWTSETLVESDDDVSLGLSFDSGRLRINLDKYHVENLETKRTFHSDVGCRLDPEMMQKLHSFISLCMNNQSLLTADQSDEE